MASRVLWLLAALALARPCAADPRGGVVYGTTEYRAPAGGKVTLYRKSIAVVIGIDAYQHLPPLTGAKRDARQMAAYLGRNGFEVTLLLDGAATRQAITQLVGDELPAKVQPDDRVLIYFAGHGLSRGQDAETMGYLMPVEGKREAPASSAISMAELQRWFGQYPARHVLYLADACYSGLAIGSRAVGLPPGTGDYVAQVLKRPVRIALVAGAAGQEAHEYRGNGLFTGFVLEGLRGAADGNRDGLITTDELVSFVKPNVARVAASELHSAQLPQLGRSGEGEFLFVTPRDMPAEPDKRVEKGALAEMPDSITVTEADQKVTVHCNAGGAMAEIDGKKLPAPATFSLRAGRYVARCTAPGYLLAFAVFEAGATGAATVSLAMRAVPKSPPVDFLDRGSLRLGWAYDLLPRDAIAFSTGNYAKVRYTEHDTGNAIAPTQVSSTTMALTVDAARAAANPAGAEIRWVGGGAPVAFSASFAALSSSGPAIPVTVRESDKYRVSLDSSNYELGDVQAGVPGTVTGVTSFRTSFDAIFNFQYQRLRLLGGIGLLVGYASADVYYRIGAVDNTLTASAFNLGFPLLAGADWLLTSNWLLSAHYTYALHAGDRRGAVLSIGWVP